MSTLRIRLFGSLHLERDGQPLARLPSRKVRDLFAYLALNRQACHPREHLAGLLWGDSDDDRARHSLNTTLWRLNGVLANGVGDAVARGYLRVTAQEIGLNPGADIWLDVAEFESRCALAEQAGASDEQASLYHQAVSFYTGDLLPDCYEEWCSLERDRLQVMYLRALTRLVSHHAKRGEHNEAIDCARRLLSVDALREEVHRELIELYLAANQPAAALRQYRQCEDILQRELAVSPMRETQALLTKILALSGPLRIVGNGQTSQPAVDLPRLADVARDLASAISLLQEVATTCAELQARLLGLSVHHDSHDNLVRLRA